MFRVKSLLLVLFVFLLVSPAYAQESSTPLVSVASTPELGKFLVGKDGMTLYLYTPDPLNETVCYDKCAEAWPPLLVESADKLTVADGIPGTFATIKRKDEKLQVTYNGIALYYWIRDKKAGDTTGQRVGRIWWVVTPATVYSQPIPKLGTVLVGPKGMTLYMFTKDTADTSNCYDQCATNWPPLTVKSKDDFVPGLYLHGKFGTAARKDGALQVTYNGMPLYYWKDDKGVGDSTGENVGKVWFTVVPESVTVVNNKDLGDHLVTPDGMTLYVSSNDTTDTSACTGDCLKANPPYVIRENERLAAGALKGKLGTIKRDDNRLQVTYNGAPLYLSATDKAAGNAAGVDAAKGWSVVKP